MASLERAALLHDLGKLAMPEAVLRKPAPLTIEEQDLIRQHPQIARDLIARRAVPRGRRGAGARRARADRRPRLSQRHARRGRRARRAHHRAWPTRSTR